MVQNLDGMVSKDGVENRWEYIFEKETWDKGFPLWYTFICYVQ
jgi:hypothetical protein